MSTQRGLVPELRVAAGMHGAGRLTPAQRAKAWLRGRVNRLLEAAAAKRQTRRAIRELSALSDRELRDIGLTRSEIVRVASQHMSRF
jgi:uncharacterized protein YjiS (DUF1127 family)